MESGTTVPGSGGQLVCLSPRLCKVEALQLPGLAFRFSNYKGQREISLAHPTHLACRAKAENRKTELSVHGNFTGLCSLRVLK